MKDDVALASWIAEYKKTNEKLAKQGYYENDDIIAGNNILIAWLEELQERRSRRDEWLIELGEYRRALEDGSLKWELND